MKFNNVEISQETILATRQHFADSHQCCLYAAISGELFVNDLDSYRKWQTERIAETLAGGNDNTFTFMQRAYWIESVPMFIM